MRPRATAPHTQPDTRLPCFASGRWLFSPQTRVLAGFAALFASASSSGINAAWAILGVLVGVAYVLIHVLEPVFALGSISKGFIFVRLTALLCGVLRVSANWLLTRPLSATVFESPGCLGWRRHGGQHCVWLAARVVGLGALGALARLAA